MAGGDGAALPEDVGKVRFGLFRMGAQKTVDLPAAVGANADFAGLAAPSDQQRGGVRAAQALSLIHI